MEFMLTCAILMNHDDNEGGMQSGTEWDYYLPVEDMDEWYEPFVQVSLFNTNTNTMTKSF